MPPMAKILFQRAKRGRIQIATCFCAPQGPVDLVDGGHAWLVFALFDAVEGFGPYSGAAGQLGLRQAQLAAGAKNVAGQGHCHRFQDRIVACGVRFGHRRFPGGLLRQVWVKVAFHDCSNLTPDKPIKIVGHSSVPLLRQARERGWD